MSALGSVESRARYVDRLGAEPDPYRDLAHYLASEFRQGQPMRVSTWRTTATGRALSDRMVSRLEALSAMQQLPYRQRRVCELLYVEDRPSAEIARALGVSERTVRDDRQKALTAMIATIYEWPAISATSAVTAA